jgi:hypothetical protein
VETINKPPKLENIGNPIELNQNNFGRDVYLLPNGCFFARHLQNVLDAANILTEFEYKSRTYKLTNVLGFKLLYVPSEESKCAMRIIFEYNKIDEWILPRVRKVLFVYGGLPTVSICVKIESKWNERCVAYKEFLSKITNIAWFNRESRTEIYNKLQAGESLEYWIK